VTAAKEQMLIKKKNKEFFFKSARAEKNTR
jgi:hypothetical protein